jgi:GNAT superfamily N-acetyltransferase
MTAKLAVGRVGCTDLPRGTIASVVTYLDMRAPPPPGPPPQCPGAGLARLLGRDEERYTAIFRVLGERWLWWSRLARTAAQRAAILDDARVEAYAFTLDGADAGLLELDFRVGESEAELAFFGLFDAAIGTSAAHWLMHRALAIAWARPGLGRLYVHTCTIDHPRALAFYRRAGFRPYRRATEVAPDPRLSGVLSRAAAPHVPIME